MSSKPLLLSVNYQYFHQLLDWKAIKYSWVGELVQFDGFSKYNNLISINKIFSAEPMGDPVDRTGNVVGALNFRIVRPWKKPGAPMTIEEVFESRVKHYLEKNQCIDIFWSGGADSTAIVTAFLQHCPDISRLRLIYSPYSLYENRNFFEFVTKAFPNLVTVDFSGDVYLKSEFNNIIVTGHGGDEFTASLDEEFYKKLGNTGLKQSWKDFFWAGTHNTELIDFCEEYFNLSGRPIESVLEARWWFYAATKSQVYGPRDSSFLFNQHTNSVDQFSSFYDCYEFEDYVYNNTECLMDLNSDYRSYKKFLRHYIHKFYNNNDYLENTAKLNSTQFQSYRRKKIEMLDLRWVCLLEDSCIIRTKNLPLFSKKEFTDAYGNSLDYLFNLPG